MSTFDEFYREIKKVAVEHWKKDNYDTFKGAEEDPIVNLFLSAFAYQAFNIKKDMEGFETKSTQEFRDRVLPHDLIKPMPAFSVVQTKLTKPAGEENGMWEVDESASFEFTKGKYKFNFSPLLQTKVINAELRMQEKTDRLFLADLHFPAAYSGDLSGLSFYFECEDPVDVEIQYNGKPFPLIKPIQYNELPFTRWFNNNHLFLKENNHLFGSYDYWQEVFLTNNVQLFYIDRYDPKDFVFENNKDIRLEIFFKHRVDPDKCDVRINCVPMVNVEKRDLTLADTKPIQELITGNGEFLNLLLPAKMEDNASVLSDYEDSFLIRQFGVERYNARQLLKQLHDLSSRYVSDHYAFQHIDTIKNDSNYEKMQQIMRHLENLREAVEKINHDVLKKFERGVSNNYYAILRLNKDLTMRSRSVYLEYLCTAGSLANGIKKNEKPTRVSSCFDRNDTFLLRDVEGGKDSVNDEAQKERIARYYLLTKDRLVTTADVRAFCYKELEGHAEKVDIKKKHGLIDIHIKLSEDYLFQYKDRLEGLADALQKKVELHSSGVLPYHVHFE